MTRIFIDDTGSPGTVSESKYDSKDRKTWVALILNDGNYKVANNMMAQSISQIKEFYGATEFHFTDILQGKKEFEGVDFSERIDLINYFADFYRNMNFPLVIQTVASQDYARNRLIVNNIKIKADNFKLSNNSELALFCLLFRIKVYMQKADPSELPFEIIIDSGRQDGNTTQSCQMFGDKLKNGVLRYERSHEEPMLQLVDYAAFFLNKHWLILSKTKKSDLDKTLWQISGYANFNVINMVRRNIGVESNTVRIYDEILNSKYILNDLLPDLEIENLISDFYR